MKKIPSININLSDKESQNRSGSKKDNLKKSNNNNNKIIVSINHLDNNINNVSQKRENINNRENKEAFISYYFVEYQNKQFRDTMEDFHDYKNLSFDNFKCHYFSIFDGHNGVEVALYLKDNFHKVLLNELKLISFTNDYKLNNSKIISAIKNSFETIDKNIINNKKIKDDIGSTGTVIFIYLDPIDNSKRMMVCANVGDSKGFLVTNENIKQITKDHKCDDTSEVERIKKFGGMVFQGRVFGSLMVTRSFGDKEMKLNGVVSIPFCFSCLISDNDKYIIAGSDGVWDAFQNINDIYELSKEEMPSEIFVKKIVQLSIDRGTTDNISCLVLKLNKIN
jgi:serine/threonine protein phosphatase PrpC